jgi:hypothetical protein
MKIVEILVENNVVDIAEANHLYHTTTRKGILGMLKTGYILPSSPEIQHGWGFGATGIDDGTISMTRDPRYWAFHFADTQIILDRDALRNNHKVTLYGSHEEFEERVTKPIPFTNVYVKKVIFVDERPGPRTLKRLKELGIPYITKWPDDPVDQYRMYKEEQQVTELYEPESSFPLNWYPSHDPSEASARAYDRNKGYIDIKFTPILGSDDMVEVEFSRNDSYDMTGGGDANRVLGTVLQAFREYLQGYQPKILVFSAKGASRSKVYQNLIKRFASTVGYKQFDISKLSPETQEKIAFSGSDLMVLRKTINELNHAPAIDEMAGEIHGGVRKALIDQGYKYLGSGIDKQAYLEPSTGQTLIIFGYRKNIDDFSPDQRMFIDWMNYCNTNKSNPHLPKFSGFESFQFHGKNYIQARMEALKNLPEEVGMLVKQIDDVVDTMKKQNFKKQVKTISDYATFDSADAGENIYYEIEDVLDYLGGEQAAMDLLQTVYQVKKFGLKHGFSIDLHSGNYMMREDGTIVVNDPFVIWLRSK